MIYLDNAATTGKKPQMVIKAVENALKNYSANPGRGGHSASIKASEKIYKIRQKIASYFGAKSESSICFTYNCTAAINTVLKGVLNRGDHVIVSSLEHNAVMRPIHSLKGEKGVEFSIAEVNISEPDYCLNSIKKLVKNNTKLIFLTHASNVTGTVLPINEIGAFCRENNILFAVDAAQSAGHIRIDMKEMGIDYLCIAPHKGLYAPMGVGILIAEKDIDNVLIEGGTGVNSKSMLQPESLPERIESGTVNLPAIFGVGAGVDFISDDTVKNRINNEESLTRYAAKLLRKANAEIYGDYSENSTFAPVLSFNIKGVESEMLADYLSRNNIAVRGGLQCAPFAHKSLGTFEQGTVRISTSVFNSEQDIEKLAFFVKKFAFSY